MRKDMEVQMPLHLDTIRFPIDPLTVAAVIAAAGLAVAVAVAAVRALVNGKASPKPRA